MKYTHQNYPAWRYSGTPDNYTSRIIESAEQEQGGWEASPADLDCETETEPETEPTKAELVQVASELGIKIDGRWRKARIRQELGI